MRLKTAAVSQITIHLQAETQYYSQFGRYANHSGGAWSAGERHSRSAIRGSDSESARGWDQFGLRLHFSCRATATGYAINAKPQTFNSTGRRTFYSDETLVTRGNWTQEPATKNSPEINAQTK